MALTSEQVLALAPDASSAKSGKALATAASWVLVGCNEQLLWGECKGSAKQPYSTQIDLRGPAFRCSCPSRKFPCKHAIGLLLLHAAQPGEVPQTEPPPAVAEWFAKRTQSEQQRAERHNDTQQPTNDEATNTRRAKTQARTAVAREVKVAAGVADLSRWMRDQLRQGFAATQTQPSSTWNAVAARMVDAQAPGLARQVRAMASTAASGADWQARLLEQFALLHLLLEGYRRLDTLAPPTQADVRTTLGFTTSQDELLTEQGVRDHWLVLGQQVEDEERLRVQRSWLWGERSAQPALVLDFSAAGQMLDKSLVPGTVVDAELTFFPSATPLRAVVKEHHQHSEPITTLSGSAIEAAIGAYAAAVARNPWLERFPLVIGPATLARADEQWSLRDEAGRQLPLASGFDKAWLLLALSGGQPITLAGAWDGTTLQPFSAWVQNEFVPL